MVNTEAKNMNNSVKGPILMKNLKFVANYQMYKVSKIRNFRNTTSLTKYIKEQIMSQTKKW